jgi:deazaflavin-dependent oxidoreductase (nitroreductase family)
VKGNDFVKLLVRSPLHGLLPSTMLITVVGRRSGRRYSVPVNFHRDRDTLWIMSRAERTWWRNIGRSTQVDLELEGRSIRAAAELVLDEACVADAATAYVRAMPLAARSLDVRMQAGAPNSEDIARLASTRVFIKVSLPHSPKQPAGAN